jgi:hypothetical protein
VSNNWLASRTLSKLSAREDQPRTRDAKRGSGCTKRTTQSRLDARGGKRASRSVRAVVVCTVAVDLHRDSRHLSTLSEDHEMV